MSNIQNIKQDLDRNKTLDEGIFLAIRDLNMYRNKEYTTGVIRLKLT